MKPPPIIGNARVLDYAMVGDAVFTGTLCLYVNEERLGPVPCLAICESFDGNELLLLHCDAEWDVRGIQAWKKAERVINSIEELKSRAEKYYAGISSKWIAHDASTEEVEAYQASLMDDTRCSFCGRSMSDFDSFIEGADARICNLCLTSFYEELILKRPRG
jgi:hypothetical protein